jgi:hypothetical protein
MKARFTILFAAATTAACGQSTGDSGTDAGSGLSVDAGPPTSQDAGPSTSQDAGLSTSQDASSTNPGGDGGPSTGGTDGGCASASASSGSAPAPAAAVGYNTLTFGPNVTLGTTASPTTGYPVFNNPTGSNWVPYSWDGVEWQSIGAVQNADGSVSMDGTGQAYGDGLTTAAPSISYGNATEADRLVFNGTAFGGGAYFVVVMKNSAGGPMSFWMDDVETMNGGSIGIGANPWPGQAAGYGNWVEVDMMEFDTASQYGIHTESWYGVSPNNPQTDLGPTSPDNSYGYLPLTPQPDYTRYHEYGYLWVPATDTKQGYGQWYFDGNIVSNTVYWNKYNPALAPPPVNGTTAGSIADVDHFTLFLGGYPGTTTTVQSVSVWQASAANDICQ